MRPTTSRSGSQQWPTSGGESGARFGEINLRRGGAASATLCLAEEASALGGGPSLSPDARPSSPWSSPMRSAAAPTLSTRRPSTRLGATDDRLARSAGREVQGDRAERGQRPSGTRRRRYSSPRPSGAPTHLRLPPRRLRRQRPAPTGAWGSASSGRSADAGVGHEQRDDSPPP